MAVAFLPVADVNNAVQMLIGNAPAVQGINRITYEGPFLYSESDRETGRLTDSIDWDCVHNKV